MNRAKPGAKTESEVVAASLAFFPLTIIAASFHDSRRAVPGLLTSSYTTRSRKPSIHELIVDVALCSQYLATAGYFKAYAIGQA